MSPPIDQIGITHIQCTYRTTDSVDRSSAIIGHRSSPSESFFCLTTPHHITPHTIIKSSTVATNPNGENTALPPLLFVGGKEGGRRCFILSFTYTVAVAVAEPLSSPGGVWCGGAVWEDGWRKGGSVSVLGDTDTDTTIALWEMFSLSSAHTVVSYLLHR